MKMTSVTIKKLFSLGVLSILALWPELVLAATNTRATDVYGVYSNAANNVGQVPKAVAIIAYASGAFFSASGLMKLKDWVSDNERNPINPALFRLGTGAFMFSLPWVLVIATGSIYGYKNGSLKTVDVDSRPGVLSPFCTSTGTNC